MGINEKLMKIQVDLKVPKNQYNSYGGFNYRSCEDIVESLKPLLNAEKVIMYISDTIENINDRYYIKATVTIIDCETGEKLENTAFAREPASKKGMDESQITGTASSYARKYALNGLFCIDDTKDADSNEYRKEVDSKPVPVYKCRCCGADIPSIKEKSTSKTLSPAEVFSKLGGLCPKCFQEVKNNNAT